MKKLIVLSVILALMLLAWSVFVPAQPQEPTNEEKPTFYRLVPGTYVNGWPRFTIHYPKDWVEVQPGFTEAFRAVAPGPVPEGSFAVLIFTNLLPLEKFADLAIQGFRNIAQDVTLVGDKPSQLRDGTPAREVEIKMVINGEPRNNLSVATKKGDTWIQTMVGSGPSGKMGEDRKAILYSLEFQSGKDEPVKLPPDVQEFLDKQGNDILSHDVVKVMANYSDKYLNSGIRKGGMERIWRQLIGGITSEKMTFTDFVPVGDRAYLTGFAIWNIFNNIVTVPITDTSIIKESGEWKWYGNQRDVSRR